MPPTTLITFVPSLDKDGKPEVRRPRRGEWIENHLTSTGDILAANHDFSCEEHPILIRRDIDTDTCPIDQLPGWERIRKALSRWAKNGSSDLTANHCVRDIAAKLRVYPWNWRADLAPEPPKPLSAVTERTCEEELTEAFKRKYGESANPSDDGSLMIIARHIDALRAEIARRK